MLRGGRTEGDVAIDDWTDHAVMVWFDTDDAERQVRRLAGRSGLSGYDALADTVLVDAKLRVWRRLSTGVPLVVDHPGGYGTVVIRRVLRDLVADRDRYDPLDRAAPATVDQDVPAEADVEVVDELRSALEHLGGERPWLTSAALAWLTLTDHPDLRPDGAPWPQAGARPDQARCWPSLWFAGQRDLFDVPSDRRAAAAQRRTRARRIDAVLTRLREAAAAAQLGVATQRSEGADHG